MTKKILILSCALLLMSSQMFAISPCTFLRNNKYSTTIVTGLLVSIFLSHYYHECPGMYLIGKAADLMEKYNIGGEKGETPHDETSAETDSNHTESE